ncbi:MAG: hypothetical protein K6E33_04370 [Lachnospiraceae bacterium]|nr:hypothetical protein [Lachnospiraceae bacterium]
MDKKEEEYLDNLLNDISIPEEEEFDADSLEDSDESIGLDGLMLMSEDNINSIIGNASAAMDEPVLGNRNVDAIFSEAAANDSGDRSDLGDISSTLSDLDNKIAVDKDVNDKAVQALKDEEEAGRLSVDELDGIMDSIPDEGAVEKEKIAREKREQKRKAKEEKAAEKARKKEEARKKKEEARKKKEEARKNGKAASDGGFFGRLFGKKKNKGADVAEGAAVGAMAAGAAADALAGGAAMGSMDPDEEVTVPTDSELADILAEVATLNMDGTPIEGGDTEGSPSGGGAPEGSDDAVISPSDDTGDTENIPDIPGDPMTDEGAMDEDISPESSEDMSLMDDITQGASEETIDLGLGGDSEDEEEDGGKKGKKKKKKKEKGEKKGFFAAIVKMFSEALDDDEEDGAKVAISEGDGVTGIVSDENQAILNELDQELDQIPEGKKKKKKKEKKPKKEKKKKEKKPKKQKEPREKKEFPFYMPKFPGKSILLVVLMSITLTALVMVICLIVPAQMALNKARKAFDENDYAEAYMELYGQKLAEEDQVKFEKSLLILKLDRYISKYNELVKEGKRVESLDALLEGVDSYESMLPLAQNFGIQGELDGEYSLILTYLMDDFGVTEETAKSINGETDDLTYTERVYEAAGVPLPAEKASDIPDMSGVEGAGDEPVAAAESSAEEMPSGDGWAAMPVDGEGAGNAGDTENGETAPPAEDEGTVLFDIKVN